MSAFVGCTGGILVSASRSIWSKIITEDEVGKAFALLSCGESLSTMIGSVVFSRLYNFTLPYWAGTTFVLDALVYVLVLLITLWFMRDVRQCGYQSDEPGVGLDLQRPFRDVRPESVLLRDSLATGGCSAGADSSASSRASSAAGAISPHLNLVTSPLSDGQWSVDQVNHPLTPNWQQPLQSNGASAHQTSLLSTSNGLQPVPSQPNRGNPFRE